MSPDEHMAKASRALASAKLLQSDGDTEGACNRAYYAMFDAARATLVWSGAGVDPASIKTHRGLIAAFGQHLIKTELLPIDLGRSLNQVERIRLLADYTGEALDEERVGWAVGQAERFVQAVRVLVTASAG